MNIPLDKQGHFLGGYALGLTFGLLHPGAGIASAAAAGWVKEQYDKRHPETHTYDKWDMWATIAGGACGEAVAALYHCAKAIVGADCLT